MKESTKINVENIRKGLLAIEITKDKVTNTISDDDVRRLIYTFTNDWNEKISSDITSISPVNLGKLIYFVYGYEYSKMRPDLQHYYLDYNQTRICIDTAHNKYIKLIYPTMDELVANNQSIDLFNNINIKVDYILKTVKEHPDQNIDFLAYMLGVKQRCNDVYDTLEPAQSIEIFNIQNEELKALILSKRPDIINEHLTAINTYADKKDKVYTNGVYTSENLGIYTLYQNKMLTPPLNYVKAWDYSSDRMFLLGVPSEIDNAKDAIASLLRIPNEIKAEWIEGINRQGEKFSLYLTKKGEEVSKKLPESSFLPENTYCLSGDNYFKLMMYEY